MLKMNSKTSHEVQKPKPLTGLCQGAKFCGRFSDSVADVLAAQLILNTSDRATVGSRCG